MDNATEKNNVNENLDDEIFEKLKGDELDKVRIARNAFMSSYKNKPILTHLIPEIAGQLMHDEFGIDIRLKSIIPIVFVTGWTHILQFMADQPNREYSINVCGLQIAYTTEYSEGDKPSNIVPIMHHIKAPVFIKQHQTPVSGSDFVDTLLQKYNSWRSVNLEEIIDKIELDTFNEVRDKYAIDLGVSAAVFPILAAVYATALQLAKDSEEPIELYNVFKIKYNPDAEGDNKYFPKELALIKQILKGDMKNTYMNDEA